MFDESEVSVEDYCEESQETVVSKLTCNKNEGKRKPLPDYLPRETVEHRLSENEITLDNGLKYEEIGSMEIHYSL